MANTVLAWLKVLWYSGTILKSLPVLIEVIQLANDKDAIDDDIGDRLIEFIKFCEGLGHYLLPSPVMSAAPETELK